VVIKYELPTDWIRYDPLAIVEELVEAKAAVHSLTTTPYQRDWVEKLQQIQLKMEVAGTSRIEGADFTENELEVALDPSARVQDLLTRSQRQAHAAVQTYRWIAHLPPDQPIDGDLIRQVHSRIIKACDDDHCPPGQLRNTDSNVTFANPRHRGCEGGEECEAAFDRFISAIQREFRGHDLLVQALALHYHLAAMHPFLDGNGRAARAMEALVLQRAGLRDTAFIAMSNYYYDEKAQYLKSLADVRVGNHDLTPFLIFGLRGIAIQCRRLFGEIHKNMAKALFRNMMYDLFNRLENTRKRVIKDRQIELLKLLLDVEEIDWHQFVEKIRPIYGKFKSPGKALRRDVAGLMVLNAIDITKLEENRWKIFIKLEWPSQITESDFFEKIKKLPKGKTYSFLP
jgi:Fic family protein